MFIMAFVATVMLFAIVFPDSLVGRFVADLFIRRGKPLSAAKITALMLSFLVISVMATVCPLDLALLADLGAYSEFLLVVVIGLSRVRLRHLSEGLAKLPQWVSAKAGEVVRTVRAGVRARRVQRPKLSGKSGKDSEPDGAGWAFA